MATAEGADSSDDESKSLAKKLKTGHPSSQEQLNTSAGLGAMPLNPAFVGVNSGIPYVGHMPLPMVGAVPAIPAQSTGTHISSAASKINYPSINSQQPSNSASSSVFAAYGYIYILIFFLLMLIFTIF